MGEIIDTVVLVLFVLFMVFLVNGFVRQVGERKAERLRKEQEAKQRKEDRLKEAKSEH